MSLLKEVTSYNKNKKQKLVNPINLPQSFPPLDQIREITLVDQNGTPYVYRLLENKPEAALDTLDDKIACENLSIDLNDIKETFIMLTDDQRNIVMHVYFMYKNNIKNVKKNEFGEICEDNPRIILQGPAGTGKSTIINLIEKLITLEQNKISESADTLKVLKCAFTGKAAVQIEGVTLNYMFSIPYKTTRLARNRLASKKELLKDCIFFICDEISMVGRNLMDSVNMRLQQIFDNAKLYGDRFVLLVGDLHQIDPVLQKPIYPNSELWTCCEFYELNKIIRQQDEEFINALNNFRDSQMTEDNIRLLRSRETQDIDEVPDSVIHLFYLNNDVDNFNIEKINKSGGEEEIVNAMDDGDDWVPGNLRVKIGIRYMITKNMNVGDGLANGTTGIVKGFSYDKNGSVDVIWIDFHSEKIGKKARTDYLKKHDKPGFENWVPLHRSSIVVKLKDNPKVSRTVGNMFPLKAAEAITVHKSQGQTYQDGVCIHITEHSKDKLRFEKSLLYVALTRVKRLEDLYIHGNLNICDKLSNKFIRTNNELNRLRTERKLKLGYETFEDKTEDVIIFLNTGLTFNEHYQFITSDKWYYSGSLLIFTETNTIGSDEIEIPNYEIIFRSDSETALRSGGGIICYKESIKSVKVISSIVDDENKIFLTLLLYDNFLFIIVGLKENMSDDCFKRATDKFISQYIQDHPCIFFIGSFDVRPGLSSSLIEHFNNNLNLTKKISSEITSTNEESQCDVLFTRNYDIQREHMGFYEYIPSKNKPFWCKIPRRVSNNYENSTSSQVDLTVETMQIN